MKLSNNPDISHSMNKAIKLRNTLIKLNLLLPVKHKGGDLQFIIDEIEFVCKMEIKRVKDNGRKIS